MDYEDYMCPNCVTPWECNGPHLSEESQMTKEEAALQKVIKKMITNGTCDELAVAILEDSLEGIVDDLVTLTRKFPLEDHQMKDFLRDIEVGSSLVEVLKYYTTSDYAYQTSYLEACADLVEEPKKVSLELEEAIVCAKLGVEMILHCEMSGVPIKEIPELIRLRGEYLKQEPDKPDPKEEMKRLHEEYAAIAEKDGYGYA